MIINALCDYYDILSQDGESCISSFGYEKNDFYYEIVLTEDGGLSGIIPLVVNKKKDKPKSSIMPSSMKNSSIAASPVCDNMAYIFGVDGNKGENIINIQKFDSAKQLHLRMFQNAVSKEAVAIRRFFEQWDPKTAWENETIIAAASEKGNAFAGNAAFRLAGESRHFHDCDEIKDIWLNENKRLAAEEGEYSAQCSITGEYLPIARLHTQLRGVKGALSTGALLVCFKKDADQSYNLSQSYNSRVSEAAMFKYTTALQHLLDSSKNKLYIGDDTVIFWACSPDKSYENIAYALFAGGRGGDDGKNGGDIIVDKDSEETIKSVLEHGRKGVPMLPKIDADVRFYVLGLAPNSKRISVRYFHQSSFGGFCEMISRYYDDTRISGRHNHIRVRDLIWSTINTKSKEKKANPLLGGAVMRAMLSGGDCPRLLLSQVILRVKAETSVTQARAAAIKLYLKRNKKEEWLSMALNAESRNIPYVLGRAFALLEKMQRDAAEVKLNTTIKDRYFASACSNPVLVFPSLIKLAQHHLPKLSGNYLNNELQKCLALVEGETFPKAQNMEQQGSFILGYYQQNAKLYEKREDIANGSDQE